MNCNDQIGEACFVLGVNDAFVWKIPDATIDPLGYTLKLESYTFVATESNGAVVVDGNDVIVSVPILAVDFTEADELRGSIVSNTKDAGVYEEISILAKFNKAKDAV